MNKLIASVLLIVSLVGIAWCAYNISMNREGVLYYWISVAIFAGCVIINIATILH